MNWLTNFVRPKIQALVGSPKELPDNLWEKCPGCNAMLFKRELEADMNVCRHCGFHLRLSPAKRLELLFDDGAYTFVKIPAVPLDPLKFKDQKRYIDRLKESQAKTKGDDALLVAKGRLGGALAIVAVFDFSFMGGSMGMAVGEGLVAAAKRSVACRAPLVVVTASGGARMQEGLFSLMQMPRSIIAARMVKKAGLPFVVVFTDPTTGGVTASFAMIGDVHIAEKGALIGFAGARVIEKTIREPLPQGFQRAEYLQEHGMVDIVVARSELKATLVRVLTLLGNKPAKEQTRDLLSGPIPHGAHVSGI